MCLRIVVYNENIILLWSADGACFLSKHIRGKQSLIALIQQFHQDVLF